MQNTIVILKAFGLIAYNFAPMLVLGALSLAYLHFTEER
jgi:hypothetical protein